MALSSFILIGLFYFSDAFQLKMAPHHPKLHVLTDSDPTTCITVHHTDGTNILDSYNTTGSSHIQIEFDPGNATCHDVPMEVSDLFNLITLPFIYISFLNCLFLISNL